MIQIRIVMKMFYETPIACDKGLPDHIKKIIIEYDALSKYQKIPEDENQMYVAKFDTTTHLY